MSWKTMDAKIEAVADTLSELFRAHHAVDMALGNHTDPKIKDISLDYIKSKIRDVLGEFQRNAAPNLLEYGVGEFVVGGGVIVTSKTVVNDTENLVFTDVTVRFPLLLDPSKAPLAGEEEESK